MARLLPDALDLWDGCDAGEIAGHDLHAAIAVLEPRADVLMGGGPIQEPNRTLLTHLRKERDALFSFLRAEGVLATNHEGERVTPAWYRNGPASWAPWWLRWSMRCPCQRRQSEVNALHRLRAASGVVGLADRYPSRATDKADNSSDC